MAHVMKLTASALGGLTRHYERAKTEEGEFLKFGNQEIDTSKTHLNYNLAPERSSQLGFIKKRTGEVRCLNRKDVNIMCSWVVTKPEKITKSEEKEFFEESYKFLKGLYGEENIISSYVHNDETTPHLHFAFVPIVLDKNKDIYKVSAKEVLTRKHLQTFHSDLDNHMQKVFSRNIGILNESTKEGNKSIEELKRGTTKKQLEALMIDLETSKSELGIIALSKGKIKELEQIKAKEKLFNKEYVEVKRDDFENLISLAKNYIKDTDFLKEKNDCLERENKSLSAKVYKGSLKDKMDKIIIDSKITELEKYKKAFKSLPKNIQNQLLSTKELNIKQNRSRGLER